jgi:multiple sugar transport system ATP-binding protein
MAAITLDAIGKTYGRSVAVKDVSLSVADGELVVLVGPSGCGKSTVLRLIAGLDAPTSGRVLLDGEDVTHVPPQQRDLAMVFQSYALYPHLTVRGNLSFGLQVRKMAATDVTRRVAAAAAALGLEPLLDRRPAELSGGQRQRVALGRAIVREPRAFLFDEPLSNLDPRLRADTRAELSLLLRRLHATMVYVTHDQEEAMTLGARIAVMRDGAIAQVGPPLEVFRRPVNAFVAGFVGSPAMNLMPGTLVRREGRLIAQCGAMAIHVAEAAAARMDERDVLVGIRPHDIELASNDQPDLAGRVEVLEPLGSATLLHVRTENLAGPLVRILVSADSQVSVGQPAAGRLRRDRLHIFDQRTGERLI